MEIELRHIHKRFGSVHANNDISAVFPAGRITGILGENGAGKSTLMKILSGFQPADHGDILVDGKPAHFGSPEDAIQQGIGMLQQDPLDVGAFSTLENFVYGRPEKVLPDWQSARSELEQRSAQLGFDLEAEAPVERMSIALRQQLEIVRLLALGVNALILDEPTTGISAEQKQILFAALQELAHRDGVIILLVSHKLEDVITLCDRVVVLRAGQRIGEEDMPAPGETDSAMLDRIKSQLVHLMFGQELGPHERQQVNLERIVLQLENLCLRDRRLQIEGLNLSLRQGEVIGLAGLDNSGQGLTMRAICGLETVSSGRVLLEDEEMTNRRYRDFLHKGVVFGAAGRREEGLLAGLTRTEHL
ncbi:MAG: ATP-binding cassette domain-containing protein, partial [Anaerolineae bacterium]|nr:ATP-binding cassette domain-containing protein [Anaerolineae bacterium]